MCNSVILVLVAVCGMAVVTSTPVYPHPNIDLSERPTDACLFMCNICFDRDVKSMLTCAQDVCITPHPLRNGGRPLASPNCKDYVAALNKIRAFYVSLQTSKM